MGRVHWPAKDWIILRVAGRSTLTLASTLGEDGFDVWTPTRKQVIRVPRMNVRREISLPLLPSFVFARSRHLIDLLELANQDEKSRRGPGGQRPAHRDFAVFHFSDRIPMIADADLEPLRIREAELVAKKDRPKFADGAGVRVIRGAFEGLVGRVERCRKGHALVIFTDWKRPVQIPTHLLAIDECRDLSHLSAHAVKAA